MVKKVFIIIGIVVGAVGAFTGAVLGIMAAQGKFNSPIVYPDAIVLPDVIEITSDDGIHSFDLSATTKNGEDVTNRDCEIEILSGAQYITLCDANGKELPTSENDYRKYLVQCNSAVYYKFKNINIDKVQNCSVTLKANTTYDERPLDSNIMRIDIDIPVRAIAIGDEREGEQEQLEPVPVGTERLLNVNMYPLASKKPFNSKDAKEIEFYYIVNGDFLPITQANIDNSNVIVNSDGNYRLRDLFEFENGVLKFKAPTKITTHEIIMLTFKTYEDKIKFDNNASILTRINSDSTVTMKLTITTTSKNLDEITARDNITLDLNKVNYISIDGSETYPDLDVINLDVHMFNYGDIITDYLSSFRVGTATDLDNVGVWLVFGYSIGSTDFTALTDNNFTIEKVAGKDKLFRIIPKDTFDEKNLKIQLRVNYQNENGESVSVSAYFSVNINVVGKNVSNGIEDTNIEFDLNFNGTEWMTNEKNVFGEDGVFAEPFDSSYDDFVLVTTTTEDYESAFETVRSVTIESNQYYILGKIQGDQFLNRIIVKDATKLTSDKKIYLMQLNLGYGVDITATNVEAIDADKVYRVYTSNSITISGKYNCDGEYTTADDVTTFLGLTGEIEWKYPKMISALVAKYGSELSIILKNNGGYENVDITSVYSNGKITFSAVHTGESDLYLKLGDNEYKICHVEVKNAFPEKLTLTVDSQTVDATTSENDAGKLIVELTGADFAESPTYSDITNAISNVLSGLTAYGYSADKYVLKEIKSNNSNVYNNGVVSVGDATLEIVIGLNDTNYSSTYYLKVSIDADYTFSVSNNAVTNSEYTLTTKDGFKYTYASTDYAFTSDNSALTIKNSTDYNVVGDNIVAKDDPSIILATITSTKDGYKFTRVARQRQQLVIKMQIDTKAGSTDEFTLTFTSSDRVELNTEDWWDSQDCLGYKEFVYGTTVSLIGSDTDASAIHSVIKYIYSVGAPSSLELKVLKYNEDTTAWETIGTVAGDYTFSGTGTYRFEVIADNETVAVYSGFKVVDNVVAVDKTALTNSDYQFQNNQLNIKYNNCTYVRTIENEDGLGAIYECEGQDKYLLYVGGKVYVYNYITSDASTGLLNYFSLNKFEIKTYSNGYGTPNVAINAENIPAGLKVVDGAVTNGNFVAPHIENVDVAKEARVLTLEDSTGRTLYSIKTMVKNPYSIETNNKITSGKSANLTIKNDDNEIEAADIQSVTARFNDSDNYKFGYSGGQLTLNTFVSETISGVLRITVTIKKGLNNLIITKDINITINPYIYDEKSTTIYSGVVIGDLIAELYDVKADSNIEEVVLTGLVGGGRTYTMPAVDPHKNITLSGFAEATIVFKATFRVVYKDGAAGGLPYAIVEREFTVTNPQNISLQYPYDDMSITVPVTIGGEEYTQYEPVALSTGMSTTISFANDEFIKRAVVETIAGSGYTGAKSFSLSIYSADGINPNSIEINGTDLILPSVDNNFMGAYVLVGVTSTSGRCRYYMLRLHKGEASINKTTSTKALGSGVEDKTYTTFLKNELPDYWKNKNVSFYLFGSKTMKTDCTYIESIPDGISKYTKLQSEAIPNTIGKYYTMTFKVYYQNGSAIGIGTIKLILKPGDGPSDTDYVANENDNGEYAYTVGATQTTVPYPFTTDVTMAKMYVGDNEITDFSAYGISFEAGRFTLSKYYDYDTEFVVTYSKDDIVYKVTYSRTRFSTNDISGAVTVGELKEKEGESNEIIKYFDNTYDLSTFLNSYDVLNASIQYSLNGGVYLKVGNSDDDDVSIDGTTLKFKQTASEQLVDLKITFNNWFDTNNQPITKIISFRVKPNYAVVRTGQGNESTPVTSAATGDYDVVADGGSTVEVKKGGSGPYTWTIGGVTIYSAENRKLKIAVADNGYSNYMLTDTTNAIASTTSLKLAHNKNTNAVVQLSLTLFNDSGDKEIEDMAAVPVWIKPLKTYNGLVVNYPSGATGNNAYENFTSGWTNNYIHTWLFNKFDSTTARIMVEKTDGTSVAATGIGVSIKGNPNYLQLVATDNVAYIENGSTGTYRVVLSNETNDIVTTTFTFKQYGDTLNQAYNIHIMPSAVDNDGIDVTAGDGSYEWEYYKYNTSTGASTKLTGVTEFANDSNSISYAGKTYQNNKGKFISTSDSTGYIYRKIKYISFLRNPDDVQYYTFNLGVLNDIYYKNVYVYGKISYNGLDYTLDTETKYYTNTTDDTHKIEYRNDKFYYQSIDGETSIEFFNPQFEFLYIDTNGMLILKLSKPDSGWNDKVLSLTAQGTSGKLLDDVSVVLFFEDLDIQVQDVYGGNGYNPMYNTETGKDARDSGYSLTYLTGSYSQTNKYENLPSDNAVFTFNSNSTIQTKAVGQDANVSITALLKKSSYIVATKEFSFKVKVNYQWVINDTNPSSSSLPVKNQSVNFEISADGSALKTENIICTDSTVHTHANNDISIALKNIYYVTGSMFANTIDLVTEFNKGNITIECTDKLFGKNIIKSIATSGSALNIAFNLDYTGDITLKLTVKTGNTDYVDYITIHCTGYVTQDKYDKVVTNNGLPFESSAEINLVNSGDQEKGILMNAPTGLSGGTWTVDYCIVPATLVPQTAYEIYDSTKKVSAGNSVTGLKLATVPNDNNGYYVVYHIQHKYLNLKDLTAAEGPYVTEYFVAYYTKNSTQFDVVHNSWSMDTTTVKAFGTGTDAVFKHNLSGTALTAFKNGISSIRLANVDGKYLDLKYQSGLDSSKAKITDLGNGKYNIDIYSEDYSSISLTNAFGSGKIVIINELVCDLQIISSEQALYECAGFKLTTTNEIASKSSKPIAEMFGIGEIDNPEYYEESIIGIKTYSNLSDLKSLVSNASANATKSTKVATITASGTSQKYDVYAVEYTQTTSGKIYTLKQTFYVIKASQVYYADYWTGTTPGQFSYDYKSSNKYGYTYYKLTTDTSGKLGYALYNGQSTIALNTLQEYKSNNPLATYYVHEIEVVSGKLVIKVAIDLSTVPLS